MTTGTDPQRDSSTVADLASSAAGAPVRRHRAPRVSAARVRRPEVADMAGLGARPVTLVCAPAGYGKTSIVADWARDAGRVDAVAWVTLETRHNQSFRFWTAVVTALTEVCDPDLAQVLRRLRPAHAAESDAFVAVLIDSLEAVSGPVWLVLDDVHKLVEPDVLAGLETLLSAPVDGLRVILLGRSDPTFSIPRLRVDGRLSELRARDLTFTQEQAESLLRIHGLQLSSADLAQLHHRTEGWPAGLRLAAVTIAHAPDIHASVAQFAGSQRAVADYLFAEVIRALPVELTEFLLATCAPAELHTDLAQQLSGRDDAGAVLEELSQGNALVMQMAEPSVYRYHSILRSYLTAEVTKRQPQLLLRQHRITADWWAARPGYAAALSHAVAGRDPDQLVHLLEKDGPAMILAGKSDTLLAAVHDARLGLDRTPTVAAICALAALDLGDLGTADTALAAADPSADPSAHPSADADPRSRVLHGIAQVQRTLLGGDVASTLDRTGMLTWPCTGEPDLDLFLLICRGPARLRLGDTDGATGDLQNALDLATRLEYDQTVLWTLSQLSGATGAACDFPAMAHWSTRAIDYARPRGWNRSPRLAYAYLLAAWTGFQTGDSQAQRSYAERALDCLGAAPNVEVALGVRSMAALAAFDASTGYQRHEAARMIHELWQTPAAQEVSPALIGFAVPHEVRLALAVGEITWAREAVTRVARLLPGSAEALHLQAELLATRNKHRDALSVLRSIRRQSAPAHVRTTLVATDVLQSRLLLAAGDRHGALTHLISAFEWAGPRGLRRPFLDAGGWLPDLIRTNVDGFGRHEQFASDIRQRLTEGTQPVRPVPPSSPLTPRELELLRDLPSQLYLDQIAAAYGVSVNTIKTHLASVYRKLGVAGRRDAVHEARRLGLI